jgi:glyoxylase-like metal-dependent hydrolase (beta-lactamase superfamily II)
MLFVGDALRYSDGRITGHSGRFTLDVDHARSMEKISKLDFDTMLSGHGEPLRPRASDQVRVFNTQLE